MRTSGLDGEDLVVVEKCYNFNLITIFQKNKDNINNTINQ
jgi:hypothetical protein